MNMQMTEIEAMDYALEAFGAGLMILFDEQNGSLDTEDVASPIGGYIFIEREDVMVKNINEKFGDEIAFDSVKEMAEVLSCCGFGDGRPHTIYAETDLIEGRDYVYVD